MTALAYNLRPAAAITPAELGRVAVLYGGNSAEREVSLRSGAAVLAGLQRAGVNAVGIDYRGNVQQLISQQPDLVFIMLHGRGGEDGALQGLLEQLGLPYTGSGVLGSALSMDKLRTKQLWQGAGLPTPEFISASTMRADQLTAADVVTKLGLPLFVKPAREGSSVGMSRVNAEAELAAAITAASKYDSEVLIERFVQGPEYTAAVVGGDMLPLIRIETAREFYDYAAKYQSGDTQYHCPAGLSAADEQRIQRLCLRAFQVAGGSGWGRVDVMVDKALGPQLIEVNTVPGMTDTSLVPMAANASDISFDQLVLAIAQLAMARSATVQRQRVGESAGDAQSTRSKQTAADDQRAIGGRS